MSTFTTIDAPPPDSDTARRVRRPSRRMVEVLVAISVYTGFVLWLSWPVPIKPSSTLFGAPGDLTGGIAQLRELVEGPHNPFAPGRMPDLNAPEGLPVGWALNLAMWPSTALLYVLALEFGATAAYNVYTLVGLVASGVAMFLFTRRMFGNPWAALVAGFAFAFYPFAVINAGGHNFAVHGWVFVLAAWRLVVLAERPALRNALWAAAATGLAMSWFPYFILLGGVLHATLATGTLVLAGVRRNLRRHLAPQVLCGTLVLGYLGALRVITAQSEQGELRSHPIDALSVYSARPLEYVVPPGGNAIVGGTTGPFMADRLHGSNLSESTLYVGVTMLLLASVGFWHALRRGAATAHRLVALAFVAVGLVAVVFSAPPRVMVLGHSVPFPSQFVFDVTSTWRAYSRFVMIAMLAICVVAAFGVARLLVTHSARFGAALLVVIAVAVPLDLYVKPLGGRITELSDPSIYSVLRRQPLGGVAQYPLFPNGYGDYADIWYQDAYDKPLLNGFAGTPQETRDLSLANLEDPGTAPGLASLGVRYVVVTRIPVEPPVVDPGKPRKGFHLVATGQWGASQVELYRVTARPGPPLVTFSSGFGELEGAAPDQFRWITGETATLTLGGTCHPCVGRLRLSASSFARPRVLTVSTPSGAVVTRRKIVGPTDVAVDLRFDRTTEVVLSVDPGSQPIAGAVSGSTDPRRVSLAVSDVRFSRRPGAR